MNLNLNLIIASLMSIAIAIGGAMPFNHVQEGGPPSLENEMVRLYERAAEDVNTLAGRAIAELGKDPKRKASRFREIRAAQLSNEIQAKLDRLGSDTTVLLKGPMAKTINRAIKRGDEEMKKIGLELDVKIPGSGASFALVAGEAVEVIAEDTINRKSNQIADALGDGLAEHGDRAKALFRSLSESRLTTNNPGAEASINTAIARGLITGNRTIADRAIRALFADDPKEIDRVRKLGNKQIVVGKATLSVRQYAATVTRTRMREATVEARHRRLNSRGVGLVQITGRNSVNFCTAFLGLVCSIGPSPEVPGIEVVPLSTLPGGGPPFHPNCSKGTSPYIHELVSEARQHAASRAIKVYTGRKEKDQLLDKVT